MKIRKSETARQMGEALTELLFPRRCPLCDRVVARGIDKAKWVGPEALEGLICPDCVKELPWIREPRCMKCGKSLEDERAELCADCARRSHHFVRGECTFLFEKAMRASVNRMKFENRREYLDFYAGAMALRHQAFLRKIKPQVIVPVPMHPRKRRARGFDQCLLLGEKLSRLTGIPMEQELLSRSRYTTPQKGLELRQRQENLQGAFCVNRREGDLPLPGRILLLDDIYTTGSTMDACCAALQAEGAQEIWFLALCTGRSFWKAAAQPAGRAVRNTPGDG